MWKDLIKKFIVNIFWHLVLLMSNWPPPPTLQQSWWLKNSIRTKALLPYLLICPHFTVNLWYIWGWFWKNGQAEMLQLFYLGLLSDVCSWRKKLILINHWKKQTIFSRHSICRALGLYFSDSSRNFWSKTPLYQWKKSTQEGFTMVPDSLEWLT